MSESNKSHRHCVGYALEPKIVNSVIPKSLVDLANQRGIDLVKIDPTRSLVEQSRLDPTRSLVEQSRLDPTRSLAEQSRFDCIIHKVYRADWKKQLDEFSAKYPEVVIIDRPELIERLRNRGSMLEVMNQINLHQENETVGSPKQWVIQESKTLDDDKAIEELGLNFPLIAKPLDNSHNLWLVFDLSGVKELSAPVVLQEFVNHGGVVFKIYIAGQHVRWAKRQSLPDISDEKTMTGKQRIPRVSGSEYQSDSHNEEGDSAQNNIKKDELPPESLMEGLAKSLKETMGLNLFNIDLIRDGRDPTRYYVIDINYFPRFARLPDYESFFVSFLWDVVHSDKLQD